MNSFAPQLICANATSAPLHFENCRYHLHHFRQCQNKVIIFLLQHQYHQEFCEILLDLLVTFCLQHVFRICLSSFWELVSCKWSTFLTQNDHTKLICKNPSTPRLNCTATSISQFFLANTWRKLWSLTTMTVRFSSFRHYFLER